MRRHEEHEFNEYAEARRSALRRTAFFLCGDWHRAEDLTQKTLIRMYGAWRRVNGRGSVDAYARQVLVRAFLDEQRQPRNGEGPVAEVPERAGPSAASGSSSYEQRDELLTALAALPPRQRAAIVLRYWDDVSVEETAQLLGISPGTVKSHCARGLAALRIDLAEPDAAAPTSPLRK